MANKLLQLPGNRLFNNSNIASPGGTATLYLSKTSTLANFLDASAVPLGPTITANGLGQLPDAYGDETVAYRVILRDSSGVQLDGGDIDPFYFGRDNSLITTTSGSSVSTRALLAAIANPVANQSAILTESGREGTFVFSTANLSAQVTEDTAQGIYVPPSTDTTGATGAWVRSVDDAISVKKFGATGDGVTDDTAAFTAAFANAAKVHIPAGTFIVSSISIPANTEITTEGFDTIVKQKAGTADGTSIIKVAGSNVSLGDTAVTGLIATSGGEQNHGVIIQGNVTNGSLENVTIGNVKGTDIRGDVVYIGGATGYTAKRISVGKVYGSNVYRNVVSLAGGLNGVNIEHIDGDQVGLYHFDHEPNAGNAPSKGVRIGYIRGRNIAIVAPDTGSYIEGERIGHFEYDSTIATSAPDYSIANPTVPTSTWPFPVQVRNVKSVHIETARIVGSPGAAVTQIYNVGELTEQFLTGGKWTISNCCQTTGTNYINGAKGHTFLDLGELEVTLSGTTHQAISGCSKSRVGPVALTTPATPAAGAALVNNSDDISLGPVSHIAGTGGTLVGASTNRVTVNEGSFAGDRLLSNATDAVLIGVVSTATTTNTNSTGYLVGCSLLGTKYAFRYEGGANTFHVDNTGSIVTANGNVSLTGTGFYNTAVSYKVSSNQVVGQRKTGWALSGITANRAALADYSATAEAAYTQATIQTLMNAVRDNRRAIESLKADLHATAGHGLIGT